MRSPRKRTPRGFTLVECLLAVVVVAVAVTAVASLVASTTRVTAAADEMTRAAAHARAVHERCLGLGRDALLALDGVTYDPPIDGGGRALAADGFQQAVRVEFRDPRDVTRESATSTDLLCVEVEVRRRGAALLTSGRLIATTRQD